MKSKQPHFSLQQSLQTPSCLISPKQKQSSHTRLPQIGHRLNFKYASRLASSKAARCSLAEIARSLGHEPYDLFIPESRSAQEVRKVIIKLEKDISDLIIQSTKLLNTIAKEGAETENRE